MNVFRFRFAAMPLALLMALSLSQTGCANMNRTGQGATVGAGAGAVIGGVIGRATGSTARGAIIGAAVGGTAGAVIGRQMDRQAAELERQLENARVERVSDPATGAEGIAIRFDNALLFDLNRATLRPQVQADLRDLARSLQNYPDHDAVIVGHASTDGPADHNQRLSEQRAQAVYQFLVAQGVPSRRLMAYGRGENEPLPGIPGTSPENRRVEIAIYPNEQYRQRLQSQYGG